MAKLPEPPFLYNGRDLLVAFAFGLLFGCIVACFLFYPDVQCIYSNPHIKG